MDGSETFVTDIKQEEEPDKKKKVLISLDKCVEGIND